MLIEAESDIPAERLRPLFALWRRKAGGTDTPPRTAIRLDDLRSAATHSLFCAVEPPLRDLGSLRIVNTGTGIVEALGVDLTGRTVADVLAMLGGTPEFSACFGEYVQSVRDRVPTYNEGYFPGHERGWLKYQRLTMPLGEGGEATGLFVVCDFDNAEVRMTVPRTLMQSA